LNALVQDTKKAITELEHQRQSVLQAIEVAENAGGHNGHSTGETELLLMELVDRLLRLNDALDRVVQEAEQIEQDQLLPSSQRLIPWAIPLKVPVEAEVEVEAKAEVKVEVETGSCQISQFYPCGSTPHDCPSR
jgi:hypothetical protein